MISAPGCSGAANGGLVSFREVPRDATEKDGRGGGMGTPPNTPGEAAGATPGRGGRGSRKMLLRREEQKKRA